MTQRMGWRFFEHISDKYSPVVANQQVLEPAYTLNCESKAGIYGIPSRLSYDDRKRFRQFSRADTRVLINISYDKLAYVSRTSDCRSSLPPASGVL